MAGLVEAIYVHPCEEMPCHNCSGPPDYIFYQCQGCGSQDREKFECSRCISKPKEQTLPTPGKESVTDKLIEHLKNRQRKGIETYGTSLQTFNGRDAIQDALEEALDLSQYLMQIKLERDELVKKVEELTKELQEYKDHNWEY